MSRPFPWVYPYQEDSPRRETTVLRPVVPITIVGSEPAPTVWALVDSGAEHVLAAPWLAEAAGIDVERSEHEIELGIGGEVVSTRFVTVSLRLHPPDAEDREYVEWESEVGLVSRWNPTWPMLAGQVGFLSRFTVTMSRQARLTAVEDWDAFDRRFGVPVVGDG